MNSQNKTLQVPCAFGGSEKDLGWIQTDRRQSGILKKVTVAFFERSKRNNWKPKGGRWCLNQRQIHPGKHRPKASTFSGDCRFRLVELVCLTFPSLFSPAWIFGKILSRHHEGEEIALWMDNVCCMCLGFVQIQAYKIVWNPKNKFHGHVYNSLLQDASYETSLINLNHVLAVLFLQPSISWVE